MATLKPRTRTISVRLSEEEYSALRRLCEVSGSRSVSDLTRDAVSVLMNGTLRHDVLVNYMDEVRAKMSSLDKRIEDLVLEMNSLKGDGSKQGDA